MDGFIIGISVALIEYSLQLRSRHRADIRQFIPKPAGSKVESDIENDLNSKVSDSSEGCSLQFESEDELPIFSDSESDDTAKCSEIQFAFDEEKNRLNAKEIESKTDSNEEIGSDQGRQSPMTLDSATQTDLSEVFSEVHSVVESGSMKELENVEFKQPRVHVPGGGRLESQSDPTINIEKGEKNGSGARSENTKQSVSSLDVYKELRTRVLSTQPPKPPAEKDPKEKDDGRNSWISFYGFH